MIEQLLNVRVRLQIYVRVRMVITRQELLDTQRVKGMARSYKKDIADALLDQLQPSQDKRSQEGVAKLTICLEQCRQLFAIDLDKLAGVCGANADKPGASGQHI